jgi:hypothetical protein
MKTHTQGIIRGRAWFVLIAGLALAGCARDPFEIRQDDEACVESLLSVRSELEEMEGKPQRVLSLEEMEALAVRPENLERAIGRKKYILHYYKRLPDKDEEIVPAKFPLHWEIDSTAVQTEGTYWITIGKADEVKVAFSCDACQQIDGDGKVVDARKTHVETEFVTPPTQRSCTEDWCFSIRPRKADLAAEAGNEYLIRIESQETYLKAAKSRIRLAKEKNPRTFRLRFTDPLEYRAMGFVKELGIAMALSDKADRAKSGALKVEHLLQQMDSLKTAIMAWEGEAASPERDAKIESLATRRDYLIEQKTELDIEMAGILPQILVISPGVPCGK